MASSGTTSTRKRFTGAEFIVHFLEQQGIKIVTGIPGGSILPVYDALSQSTQIRHILARHEQGAGFIAQGMARTDGKPAVCMACSGPGATNLVTAIADARLDSIPLICITGQVPASMIGTDAFQEVDTYGISIPITKHNYLVRHIEELPQVMSDAFRIAQSGRPGPVWIDIPKDVQTAVFEIEAQPAMAEKAAAPAFSEESIRDAAAMINAAKRPVLYLGGGVINAPARVRELAEKAQLPTTMTLMALGMLPKAHPLSLGMLGMHGVRSTNYILQEADLLIVLGARFDDRVTGKLNTFAPHASVIHMDIDPAEMNKLRQAHAALQGDLNALLPALQQPLNIDDWQQHCAQLRDEHAWRYDHPGDAIYAPLLLKQLSDRKPADCVVTTDVGQHQMWAAQHIVHTRPENFITSSGLGTMGFGLPAAVGAQVARPNDTVVCISGDGSFMMNVQELGTVKRKQLPLKIVLLDNQRLGMVRQWQQLFFQERYSETTLTDNPDFLMLASAFGIPGQHITHKDQVEAALDTMLNSDGPYLLHVSIDELENVWPLVPPGASNSEMLEKLS